MTSKRKPAKKRGPKQLAPPDKPEKDQAVARARTALRPTVQAAITLKECEERYGDLALSGLVESLTERTGAWCIPESGTGKQAYRHQSQLFDAGVVAGPRGPTSHRTDGWCHRSTGTARLGAPGAAYPSIRAGVRGAFAGG